MTIENLRDGLTALIEAGATGYQASAEHDVFYCGAPMEADYDDEPDGNASEEDWTAWTLNADLGTPLETKRKLLALGWHWDGDAGCWAAFT